MAERVEVNVEGLLSLAKLEQWPQRCADGESRRLFHGRGQCYPGYEWLTVDYFSPLLWIVLYREPPGNFWADFCAALAETLAPHFTAAIVQHRYQRDADLQTLWGDVPSPMYAVEEGLRFALQLGGRQNIGYFMDMQPARRWLTARADGRRVLNLFSYTSAFSGAARKAGASQIVNIDMSKSSLRTGRENHRLNDADSGAPVFLGHDIFKSWGKLKKLGPYDVVICDPPSRQAGSFDAARDYGRLLSRMGSLCAPGADVLICLNSPLLDEAFLRDRVAEYWPEAQFCERLAGRADFPERDTDAALKVLHYRAPS